MVTPGSFGYESNFDPDQVMVVISREFPMKNKNGVEELRFQLRRNEVWDAI
jgi:hypothetical protein